MKTPTLPGSLNGMLQSMFAPTREGRFDLAAPTEQARALAVGWLALGVLALIGSGLFSVLLVLARTPHVAAWVPGVDFFRSRWSCTSTSRCWSGSCRWRNAVDAERSERWPALGWLALWATAIGAC